MDAEQTLLQAIAAEPGDEMAWLALADCLEENGAPERAELVRLREWLRTGPQGTERQQKEARFHAMFLAGVKPAGPHLSLPLGGSATLELILIPPGTFRMGSPSNEAGRNGNEGPMHFVTLTRGFWLGQTSVTQAQWQAVMNGNPSTLKDPTHPVEKVSWDDSQAFCRELSKKSGKTFTLATEAQWEYACRAGTTSVYYAGNGPEVLDRLAWYINNSRNQTHPVGHYPPNGWGLQDMHGNVWDWCQDGLRQYRSEASVDPFTDSNQRAVRGGSYLSQPHLVRCAFRSSISGIASHDNVGCRVCWRLA